MPSMMMVCIQVILCLTILVPMPTAQTFKEPPQLTASVAPGQKISVSGGEKCTTYCDKDSTDCSAIITCDDSCPSGQSSPPMVETFFTGEITTCSENNSPTNVPDAPSPAKTTDGVGYFNTSSCKITKSSSSSRTDKNKPFAFAFWIYFQATACSDKCFVIDVLKSGTSLFFVDVSPGGIVATGATKNNDFLGGWNHIGIQYTSSHVVIFINGGIAQTTNIGTAVKFTNVEIKAGTGNGLSSGLIAVQDLRFYPNSITHRDMKQLFAIAKPPSRINDDCRCPVQNPVWNTIEDSCSPPFDSSSVRRLNDAAHYLEYAIDGKADTYWVSSLEDEVTITIEFAALFQMEKVDIRFYGPLPQSIKIESFFSSSWKALGTIDSPIATNGKWVHTFNTADRKSSRSSYEKHLARQLRLTLNGHQGTLPAGKPWNYYGISEIAVTARCACYGNSDNCNANYQCGCDGASNTEGDNCDNCKSMFFKDPSAMLKCQSCRCNNTGRMNNICDKETGQCSCRPKVEGRTCSDCKAFTYGLSNTGCQDCSCNQTGSVRCSATNGQCDCKRNVIDTDCSQCEDHHYGYKSGTGCSPCVCNDTGTIPSSQKCHRDSGKCICQDKVVGDQCDRCEDGFWNFKSAGCERCTSNCFPTGRLDTICEKSTGYCKCDWDKPNTKDEDCRTRIYGMTPAFGPIAGGTLVTISGDLLGKAGNFSVELNKVDQIPVSRTQKAIVFKTNNITSVNDFNLDIYFGVPDTPARLDARTEEGRSLRFSFRDNPSVTGVSPTQSIASGGIMLTVTGTNLENVDQPKIVVYSSSDSITRLSAEVCEHHGDTLRCPSPEVSTQFKNGSKNFTLGLEFDGFHAYLYLSTALPQFSSLSIHQDPSINKWGDEIKTFKYPFTLVIEITGTNFDLGATQSDYTVNVGNGICGISNFSSTKIVCNPPQSFPGPAGGPNNAVPVVVKVGFLNMTVGELKYIPVWETVEFIGIMAGLGGLIILVIILVVVVKKCRNKRQNRREDLEHPTSPRRPKLVEEILPISEMRYVSHMPYEPEETLFDRLEIHIRESMKLSLVEKHHIELGRICTKKGTLSRIIDGTFSRNSPQSPGMKLTIKTFAKKLPEDENVPAWVTNALSHTLLLRDFMHENILTLQGIAFDKTKAYLLYPHMANRTLKDYIVNAQIEVSIRQLVEFALQVAEGMGYLSSKGIEHRDLATRNCMLEEDLVVKISDPSFSADLYSSEYAFDDMRQHHYPLRWLAPESLIESYHDIKSDVWSYGVLVWELLTRGLFPYQDRKDDEVRQLIKDGYRLGKPESIPDDLYSMMSSCWEEDPGSRPTFLELIDDIQRQTRLSEDGVPGATDGIYANLDNQEARPAPCIPNRPSRLKKGSQRASLIHPDSDTVYGNITVGGNLKENLRRMRVK